MSRIDELIKDAKLVRFFIRVLIVLTTLVIGVQLGMKVERDRWVEKTYQNR